MGMESQVRTQLFERGELAVPRAQQRMEVAKPKSVEGGETQPRMSEMVGWCQAGLLHVAVQTEAVYQPNILASMLMYRQNYSSCFLFGQWIDSPSSLEALLWEIPCRMQGHRPWEHNVSWWSSLSMIQSQAKVKDRIYIPNLITKLIFFFFFFLGSA